MVKNQNPCLIYTVLNYKTVLQITKITYGRGVKFGFSEEIKIPALVVYFLDQEDK
jgi:hypothetical protein